MGRKAAPGPTRRPIASPALMTRRQGSTNYLPGPLRQPSVSPRKRLTRKPEPSTPLVSNEKPMQNPSAPCRPKPHTRQKSSCSHAVRAMTVLASPAAILRVHLATRLAGIIRPNECVRERSLHGGKVTQPTDTRRPRGSLSAGSLACISRPAHSRKGGREGSQPRLGSRYASLRPVSRTTPGPSWTRGLHSPARPGDAPQPGPDVRSPGLARPCGHRAGPGAAHGGPDRWAMTACARIRPMRAPVTWWARPRPPARWPGGWRKPAPLWPQGCTPLGSSARTWAWSNGYGYRTVKDGERHSQ